MRRLRKLLTLLFLAGCSQKTFTPGQMGPPIVIPPPEIFAADVLEEPLNRAADVLFVIDNAESMAEEQLALLHEVDRFVAYLQSTGARLRFAVLSADATQNRTGAFFQEPADLVDPEGRLLRDIPERFCDGVVQLSQGGVLDPDDPALREYLQNFGPIPDFLGRAYGAFRDEGGDGHADNEVYPEFSDALGCLLAVGLSQESVGAGICQTAAALDFQSLTGENSAFLSDPESVLVLVYLSDTDDCTLSFTEQDGELLCEVPSFDDPAGRVACFQSAHGVSGVPGGLLEALSPVSFFSEKIQALKGGDSSRVAVITLTGPPAPPLPEYGSGTLAPICSGELGEALSANRYFDFAGMFPHRVDALDASICQDLSGSIFEAGARVGQLLNTSCLAQDIEEMKEHADAVGADLQLRVKFGLTFSSVSSCEEIVSIRGIPVTLALEGEPEVCLLDPFSSEVGFSVEPTSRCGSGYQISFYGFNPPEGTKITVEYTGKSK